MFADFLWLGSVVTEFGHIKIIITQLTSCNILQHAKYML